MEEERIEVKLVEILDHKHNPMHQRYRLKIDAPLGKVFGFFAERFNLHLDSLRFLYGTTRLDAKDTARTVGIESGANIDVIVDFYETPMDMVVRKQLRPGFKKPTDTPQPIELDD